MTKRTGSAQNRHDDLTLLLPWFVNRTLRSEERAEVSIHLQHCAECRGELDILVALREGLSECSGAEESVSIPDFVPPEQPRRSMSEKMWWGLAGALSVGLLLAIPTERETASPPEYVTVTSKQVPVSYILGITFDPELPPEEQSAIIAGVGEPVLVGSTPGRARVRVLEAPDSVVALDAFLRELESKPGIAHVELDGVVPPVAPER